MGGGEQDDCQKNNSYPEVLAEYTLAKLTFSQDAVTVTKAAQACLGFIEPRELVPHRQDWGRVLC